jgi:uncharacterized protein YaeQ
MALKSTVFKVTLGVADLDRAYYGEHALTLARHPSETDERMMVRLLAFALFADPRLEFGKGLSSVDEPALWLKDYGGEIRLWIEVGLPDERLLRRACGRADAVVVLAYGGRAADLWWEKEGRELKRQEKLRVLLVDAATSAALACFAERSMALQCTIQDGQAWLADGVQNLAIGLKQLSA